MIGRVMALPGTNPTSAYAYDNQLKTYMSMNLTQ